MFKGMSLHLSKEDIPKRHKRSPYLATKKDVEMCVGMIKDRDRDLQKRVDASEKCQAIINKRLSLKGDEYMRNLQKPYPRSRSQSSQNSAVLFHSLLKPNDTLIRSRSPSPTRGKRIKSKSPYSSGSVNAKQSRKSDPKMQLKDRKKKSVAGLERCDTKTGKDVGKDVAVVKTDGKTGPGLDAAKANDLTNLGVASSGPSRSNSPSVMIDVSQDREPSKSSQTSENHAMKYKMGETIYKTDTHIVRRCTNISRDEDLTAIVMKRENKSLVRARHGFDIHKSCDHPNIAKIRDRFEDNDNFTIITDRITGTLVEDVKERIAVDEVESARIVRDLASALFYLHCRNIVHCDVRPESILVNVDDRNKTAFLTNFEQAVELGVLIATPLQSFSDIFIAPERNKRRSSLLSAAGNTTKADPQGDIWGLGIIAYMLLLGYEPCQPEKFNHLLWGDVSSVSKELVEDMLKESKEERMTASDVLCHPWILSEGIPRRAESIEDLRAAKRDELKKSRVTIQN